MLDNPQEIQGILRRLRELNGEPPPKYRQYKNPKIVAYLKKWQAENPDKYKAYVKKWEASSAGKASRTARRQRRRAKILGARGSFTAQEWEAKKQEFDYRCAYCGGKTKKLSADHYVPLDKGGTNYIENIVPACGKCNSHKGIQEPASFEFPGRTQMVMAGLWVI